MSEENLLILLSSVSINLVTCVIISLSLWKVASALLIERQRHTYMMHSDKVSITSMARTTCSLL